MELTEILVVIVAVESEQLQRNGRFTYIFVCVKGVRCLIQKPSCVRELDNVTMMIAL